MFNNRFHRFQPNLKLKGKKNYKPTFVFDCNMKTSEVNSNKAAVYQFAFLPHCSNAAIPLLEKSVCIYLNWCVSRINRKSIVPCLKLVWTDEGPRQQKHTTAAKVAETAPKRTTVDGSQAAELQKVWGTWQGPTFSPSPLCPSLLPTYLSIFTEYSFPTIFSLLTSMKEDCCCPRRRSSHKSNTNYSGCSASFFSFTPPKKKW